jgi:HTH-type transcriptional regulator/antitoxin HipB
MSALTKYTQTRTMRDPDFADGLESGYTDFKVGALLRQAREKASVTQEPVAERLEPKE